MAYLYQYGNINYDEILDYDIHYNAIQSIIAMCSLPIVEDNYSLNSLTVIAYEKSFWKKRQTGFFNLEYIQDAKLDLEKCKIEDDEVLPKNAEILIGFGVSSEYKKFNIAGSFITHEIGESRTHLLSYGKLVSIIEEHCSYHSQVCLDDLSSSSPVDNYLSGNMGFSTQYQAASLLRKQFWLAESKIDFLKRFLPKE